MQPNSFENHNGFDQKKKLIKTQQEDIEVDNNQSPKEGRPKWKLSVQISSENKTYPEKTIETVDFDHVNDQ